MEWNQEIFAGILLESESELESGFLMQPGIGIGIGIKDCRNRASLVQYNMSELIILLKLSKVGPNYTVGPYKKQGPIDLVDSMGFSEHFCLKVLK